MPFKIIRNDITKVKVDAIVNTANPQPVYAAGTDAVVYRAAGAEELLEERKKIGAIACGQAAVTPAFALPAKYIIHTVGPSWTDGAHGEFDILAACYENSLIKAAELKCESIAFPLIATGVYGFPKDKALQIAVSTISRFLLGQEMEVLLVVFDRHAFELSGRIFRDIDAFIDENYVTQQEAEEYRERENDFSPGVDETVRLLRYRRNRRILEEADEISLSEKSGEYSQMKPSYSGLSASLPVSEPLKPSLDDKLDGVEETFQQKLLHLIDERGMKDTEVYKRANMDRRLFSKIRCNENYKPNKKTALALAVALELSLDETEDLLKRAELALSPSSKSDLIIEYFIDRQKYNINDSNFAL